MSLKMEKFRNNFEICSRAIEMHDTAGCGSITNVAKEYADLQPK